tara:strand:- start:125 stop:685 length:561 start_codon:yes stop_codon:yes gene_type:complete
MKDNKMINEIFEQSSSLILESSKLNAQIEKSSKLIQKCFNNSGKVILFGNGGSAADAQHVAAEFIGRFQKKRSSLPAVALTTDSSIITSIGNDFSFENIFSRQCESLVNKGDVVIAISTSGNSKNILNGIKTAKKKGGKIIGLLGNKGGKMKENIDIPIIVDSNSTPRIQEVHRVILHIICELVEK